MPTDDYAKNERRDNQEEHRAGRKSLLEVDVFEVVHKEKAPCWGDVVDLVSSVVR